MASLQNLPTDHIFCIAEYLDHSSILCLRVVHRNLHDILTPLALRRIFLPFRYICPRAPNSISKKLWALCDALTPMGLWNSTNLKALQSTLGRPADDPYERLQDFSDPAILGSLSLRARHVTIVIDGNSFECHGYPSKETIELVRGGLRHFRSLKALEVRVEQREGTTSPFIATLGESLSAALLEANNHSLEKLSIRSERGGDSISKSILSISNLQILHVDLNPRAPCRQKIDLYLEPTSMACGSYRGCSRVPVAALQAIMKGNPGIRELRVTQGCVGQRLSIGQILSPEIPMPNLTSLTIKGALSNNLIIGPSKSSISPLSNLQYLNIQSVFAHGPLAVPTLIWHTLRSAQTRLQTLIASEISGPLCDYLSSYTGLQRLIINDIQPTLQYTHERTLDSFFNLVLPGHGPTLQELELSYGTGFVPSNDFGSKGWGWAFEPVQWQPVLPTLVALKSLRVHAKVNLDHDPYNRFADNVDAFVEAYELLLRHAGLVPNIELLHILWPRAIGGWCGTAVVEAGYAHLKVVEQILVRLEPPSGGPKNLVIHDYMCQLVGDSSEGKHRYELVGRY